MKGWVLGEQAWTSSMLTGLLSSDSRREERYSSLQVGILTRGNVQSFERSMRIEWIWLLPDVYGW